MADLPDNLFKYYGKRKQDNSAAKQVEVISEEEAKNPPPPPPAKKSKLISGKKAILAVIVLFLLIDIPIAAKFFSERSRSTANQDIRSVAAVPSLPPSKPTVPPLATDVPLLPSPTAAFPPATVTVTAAATTPAAAELAQTAPATHSECFNGACIEIEGAGNDECIVDADCAVPTATAAAQIGGLDLGQEASPSPTLIPLSATPIPVPDTPTAGNISETLLGILGGLGVLFVAFLL